jgi:hypothetical protein
MTEIYRLLIFIAVCFVLYIVFRNYQYNPMLIEGMTDGSGNTIENKTKSSGNGTTIGNGLAGNAAEYAAALKANTINSLDSLMISKYRGDYESALINLDDTIDILMLKTALNFNQEKPLDTLEKLSKMQQAKIALNSVMKFVDNQ